MILREERYHADTIAIEPGQRMTANAKAAIDFVKRPEALRWLLRLSRLPVTARKRPLPGWRSYLVSLYQDQVLDMHRIEEQDQWLLQPWDLPTYETVDLASHDPEVNLVKALAARSLYAAGLDVGHVQIYAASSHRAKVAQVIPDWPAEQADRYMKLASDGWKKRQSQHPQRLLMLGADPEFALRKADGSMALASDYLKIAGLVGCDTTRYREELAMHQHPVAELRPQPAEDPEDVFAYIWEALKLAGKKMKNQQLEWLAGGMPFSGYPIGGHLHFSGLTATFSLRRKLDAYLALPLVLIEDEGCQQRRERYGFLGDVREKEYGFEYRTLPSWLVHPLVTRGVLHLARLIADNHSFLEAAPHLQPALIKAYYRGEKQALKPYVEKVWRELRQLPGYRLSQLHLDRFFTILLSGQTWPAEENLRKAWNLSD